MENGFALIPETCPGGCRGPAAIAVLERIGQVLCVHTRCSCGLGVESYYDLFSGRPTKNQSRSWWYSPIHGRPDAIQMRCVETCGWPCAIDGLEWCGNYLQIRFHCVVCYAEYTRYYEISSGVLLSGLRHTGQRV